MFDHPAFDAHESVTCVADSATGLNAIIAIHSTQRGPAFGGCRAWTYANTAAAMNDVLRLARGMSYKNAVAGLPFGGGKAVILRNGQQPVSDAQFEAFGRAVERLEGRYITAEDVGVSVASMARVALHTRYVSGLPRGKADVGGDPSPSTAHGVFCGIQVAVRHKLGRDDLQGLRIAVQGLGHVGQNLCAELHAAGASLVVADTNVAAADCVRRLYEADVVSPDEILFQPADVLAPCALGGIVNAQSLARIQAPIIAGAANNQLATDQDGSRLHERGILYAPDYVINAGGIICASAEYLRISTPEVIRQRVGAIGQTLAEIFERSAATNTPTHRIADEMARQRLAVH